VKVNGANYRTVWFPADDTRAVAIIDQRKLPFAFEILTLRTVEEVAVAIREMAVRGAGCIGATAAHGMYLASLEACEARDYHAALLRLGEKLKETRPTAVNLRWAVDRVVKVTKNGRMPTEKISIARAEAAIIADEDAEWCRRIGAHGLPLIEEIARRKSGAPVNILTHCNAGWLAFSDWGSATSPIYAAHRRGIPVHVWVDETRPRNQGARLTAWELANEGVPHTVIVDNAGGHLMQHGMVDLVITGTDRTTYTGDVANKIGTYLKALAAKDNGIPFYVALPSSTFDWEIRNGVHEIPIEERGGHEVRVIEGFCGTEPREVDIVNPGSPVANHAFDVTPSRLITGLITERGICAATEDAIAAMFPPK
jgi:methylthioribose-1-phosphate isomerase